MFVSALTPGREDKSEMTEPNIILTGFMATGKTTVGKRLAKHLGYDFVDTDQRIVEQAGMSVADIFEKQGEQAFRKMESDLARELGARQGLVISTGGGMMLDPENASALGRNGRIFCLKATPEEILDRICRDIHARRPLLETADPMKEIQKLLKQREKGYARFYQIRTSDQTPGEIAESLVRILQTPSVLKRSQIRPEN